MKWYQHLFSLKNENNHKVLRFFFIKIRFKRKSHSVILPIQNEEYMRMVFSKMPNKIVDFEKLNIAFIVPQPIKGSGGHRNFYRAIKFLKDFGHDLTVYYTQTKENADVVKQRVSDWFYNMEDIPFICYEGEMGYHDAGIATWWETAYDIKKNCHKLKQCYYFVQDFEPMFYPMSSYYVLGENSYKLGFHHICSGPWCKDFLIRKYKAKAEYFQFPVDRNIYNTRKQRTKKNKNIIFFAKPDLERRCYELGIMALKHFSEIMPDVEIILFGSDWIHSKEIPFKCTKIGLLPTIEDLADLYRNADLGIAFSTTNPSLVPYEMMACGCPVVDLDIDGALVKFGNDKNNAFLLNPVPEVMGEELAQILGNPNELQIKRISGSNYVLKEFPTEHEMAQKVEQIIKDGLG